jgi:predicted nuclease of predicted toxin-antitoxin system
VTLKLTRFVADENATADLVSLMRANGLDVVWIRDTNPGAPDDIVLDFTKREQRTLITSDIELASIAMKLGTRHFGTVLLRMEDLDPETGAKFVTEELLRRNDWSLFHTVITPKKVRMRALSKFDPK